MRRAGWPGRSASGGPQLPAGSVRSWTPLWGLRLLCQPAPEVRYYTGYFVSVGSLCWVLGVVVRDAASAVLSDGQVKDGSKAQARDEDEA